MIVFAAAQHLAGIVFTLGVALAAIGAILIVLGIARWLRKRELGAASAADRPAG